MKYGIICAMPEEIDLLKKDIKTMSAEVIGNREFIEGSLYDSDVVLVMSRIGKVAATISATILIERFKVDAIIFSGTAGGISPELSVGDVVISDYCVQHDFDAKMDVSFNIPLINISYFKADEPLTEMAIDAVSNYIDNKYKVDIPEKYLDQFNIKAPKLVVGTIASGDQFICENDKKAWLLDNVDNLKCVEMEGAAVAQVCHEFSVPFTVIRVISDSADEGSTVDFNLFVREAACHFTRGTIRAFFKAKH